MKPYILGVDIGGTKCAVILAHNHMPQSAHRDFIIEKRSFPTETGPSATRTLEQIFSTIEALLIEHNLTADSVEGIGVSCGGPLNHRTGTILNPPNLYGWHHVPIVQLLQQRFHIPARLQNDANACTLAEWKFGAASGYSNVVFLTFGTGMGAGLILNGQLYCGASDMAGEVGHVRLERNGPVGYGKSGSFEGFCSGCGIAQIARTKVTEALQQGTTPVFCQSMADLDALDAKTVANAADAGDALAQEIYRICGHYLGIGLSMLIDILNPEVIVIGSIFQRSSNLLWPPALETLQQEALAQSLAACRIIPSLLGEHIGDYAALSLVLSE